MEAYSSTSGRLLSEWSIHHVFLMFWTATEMKMSYPHLLRSIWHPVFWTSSLYPHGEAVALILYSMFAKAFFMKAWTKPGSSFDPSHM